MKRPPLPYLLLLPLLAVLLFGNCGGGVYGFLSGMGNTRRERLREIVVRRQAERAAARQQLRGRARQDAYWCIEQATNLRTDSLLRDEAERRKFRNRRNKVDRRLLHSPAPPAQP
ncbi:hypothetical protein [Hymenobacter terrenus]|uniref:hypothetical protein n=1 Tax=Hymenobacter terrenus TaxID=1629124 RepID=UPI00061933DF|nr:hypothetical protein [Hymenobacter terrenus]